jgi:hypothetical protein
MRVLSFGSPSGRRDQMTFCIGRRDFIALLGGAAARDARAAGHADDLDFSTAGLLPRCRRRRWGM